MYLASASRHKGEPNSERIEPGHVRVEVIKGRIQAADSNQSERLGRTTRWLTTTVPAGLSK